MNPIDILRNNIIDKLLTISNRDYLTALYQLINKSSVGNKKVELTEEQIILLKLSENDIQNGNLISQSELDKKRFEMAKRVVVWTITASKQRREILRYCAQKNDSTLYAEKLIKLIKVQIHIISKNPNAFKPTIFEDVRV